VLEHLAEIAAIDPAAAGRAFDEMVGFVLPLLADRPPDIGASGNCRHCSFPSPLQARTVRSRPNLSASK
jgi:hypothetical protein